MKLKNSWNKVYETTKKKSKRKDNNGKWVKKESNVTSQVKNGIKENYEKDRAWRRLMAKTNRSIPDIDAKTGKTLYGSNM